MPIIFIVAIIILVLLAVIGVYAWIRHAAARRLALDTTCERKTFAEVDGFIDMLRGTCEDIEMHRTLDKILTQPDEARRQMRYLLIDDLRQKNAPRALIDAFVCLLDDAAAEKAYAVIYACERR